MYIPQFIQENFNLKSLTDSAKDSLCPAKIMSSLTSSNSTSDSDDYSYTESNIFERNLSSSIDDGKSKWNDCMDKKWCKIVAIVCIVIGSILVLWILSMIIQILCCGVKCVQALCCNCCCCSGGSNRARSAPAPQTIVVEKPIPMQQYPQVQQQHQYPQGSYQPQYAPQQHYHQQQSEPRYYV
ncbi:unnamed protein product [Ambrosiozyma monospora]|uniref:Unnamed protein product n=1 Tax=Ambrosiozyma monospora TaxID=43982 RepID=A0ACB5TW87_AMBMO|nr:unnamed protein product [Ambrosiozyma monospora]